MKYGRFNRHADRRHTRNPTTKRRARALLLVCAFTASAAWLPSSLSCKKKDGGNQDALVLAALAFAGAPKTPENPNYIQARTQSQDGQVSLTWPDVTDASSYNIYWNNTGSPTFGDTKIENVSSPHVHAGLTNGTSYYYIITAVGPSGETQVSDVLSGTPQGVFTTSTFAGYAFHADATGASAAFYMPRLMTSDGTHLYVTDAKSYTVRKIDPTTGTVTTLAGSPFLSGTADGTGSGARFSTPRGVAHSGGSLYVTDGNAVRKIVIATGVVTTFAGSIDQGGDVNGVGSAARFSVPSGIVAEGAHLYVVDSANQKIRRVALADGATTTFAGSGALGGTDGAALSASFLFPEGITSDGTNLYLVDSVNNKIRRINIGTGAVDTLAGSGSYSSADGTGTAASFAYPSDIATDGTNLYVTDHRNHTIRRIVIATAAVTTLAGSVLTSGSQDGTGSLARFHYPEGIVFLGGNLYIADRDNNNVRKLEIATSAVTTLAGRAGPSGSTDGTGLAARFNRPDGIASDGTNLYVTDSANHTVRKIVISTGAVTTLAGSPGLSGSANGTGSTARFNSPRGIAYDGSNLHVADSGNHVIRVIDPTSGAVSDLAGGIASPGTADGTGAAARFKFPTGLTTDGTNLYVADTGNHLIRKIVISTRVVTSVAGDPGFPGAADGTGSGASFAYPEGVAVQGTSLYVADSDNHTIRAVNLDDRSVTTLAGLAGELGRTDGTREHARFSLPVALIAEGNRLYVASHRAVRCIALPTGDVATVAGETGLRGPLNGTGGAARFNYIAGLVAVNGSLYIADKMNHNIRRLQ